MGQRLELHAILKAVLGSSNVYFQPPPEVQMRYPAIVYNRDGRDTTFADDIPYNHKIRYLVTVIDPNPDSEIPNRLAQLPQCIFDRFYTVSNLNHDVYRLFF